MLDFEICCVLAFPVRTFFDPKSGHLCHVLKFTALCRPRDLDVREPSSSCCLLGSSQDGGFDGLPGGADPITLIRLSGTDINKLPASLSHQLSLGAE